MNLDAFIDKVNVPSKNQSKDNYLSLFDSKSYARKARSRHVPRELLPLSIQDCIDEIASGVFGKSSSRNVVTGSILSGKTFLLDQIYYNRFRYLRMIKSQEVFFLGLNDIEMMEFSSATDLVRFIDALCVELNTKPKNLCFIVESADIATYLSMASPDIRIILEIDSNSFNEFKAVRSNSDRRWASWNVFDLDNVELERDEIVQLLDVSAGATMREELSIELPKDHIKKLVDLTMKTYEDTVIGTGRNKVCSISPGAWSMALREFATTWVFASNDGYFSKGEKSFNKVAKEVVDSMSGLIESTPDSASGKSDLEAMLFEKLSGMGVPVVMGEPHKAATEVEVKPFEFSDVRTLNQRLSQKIFGEEEIVERVSRGFITAAAGLNDPQKPIRSLLFLGPTGVGKTQLSLELAAELSTSPMNVVRIDMSEYQSAHEVSKLFGAPPGYLGFQAGGILTSAIMENPHSVVILDEIEKADPQVWDTFLQVLDAGRMTDSMGNVVDFSKTVVIMTSNLGAQEASKMRSGFAVNSPSSTFHESRDKELIVKRALEQTLRAEFINRFDDIIVFNELSKDAAKAIVMREINVVGERMAKSAGATLSAPSEEIIDILLDKSDIKKYGAREVARNVFKYVSSPAAEVLIGERDGNDLVMRAQDGEIVISVAPTRKQMA